MQLKQLSNLRNHISKLYQRGYAINLFLSCEFFPQGTVKFILGESPGASYSVVGFKKKLLKTRE